MAKPDDKIKSLSEEDSNEFEGKEPAIHFSILEVTPRLMAAVTGYSESTCRKVLYNCYPSKEVSELIIHQTNIFLRNARGTLQNVNLYDALDKALEGKRIRNAEQVRALVQLQKINEILNS